MFSKSAKAILQKLTHPCLKKPNERGTILTNIKFLLNFNETWPIFCSSLSFTYNPGPKPIKNYIQTWCTTEQLLSSFYKIKSRTKYRDLYTVIYTQEGFGNLKLHIRIL